MLGADTALRGRKSLENKGHKGAGVFFCYSELPPGVGRAPRGARSERMICAMISLTLMALTPRLSNHFATFSFVGAVCGLEGSYFVQNCWTAAARCCNSSVS